jgi:hypothetical protein
MSDQLIAVTKDGATIKVHPGTLENHIQLGWKVVDEKAKKDAEKDAEKHGKNGK